MKRILLAQIAEEKEKNEIASKKLVVKVGPPSDDELELQTNDSTEELFEKEYISDPSDKPSFDPSEQLYRWVPKQSEEDEFEFEEEDDGDDEEDEEDEDELEPIDDDKLADMCFKLDEIKILTQVGLPLPSQITESEKSTLFNKAEKLMEKFGGKKGVHVKRGNTEGVKLLDDLMNLIRVYMGLLKPKKDKTGGRYKQNRRNAYKIGSGGEYGTLVIHLPSMFKFVLEAFKDGNKVMKQPIDQDTIDLLTKRFNGSKNYSELSKGVFKKLNMISQIPLHRSSKKISIVPMNEPNNEFQFEDIHNSELQMEQPEEQIDDTDELLNRLETLIGYILDGYYSHDLKKEFIDIVDLLYDRGVVNVLQRGQLFRKYL